MFLTILSCQDVTDRMLPLFPLHVPCVLLFAAVADASVRLCPADVPLSSDAHLTTHSSTAALPPPTIIFSSLLLIIISIMFLQSLTNS